MPDSTVTTLNVSKFFPINFIKNLIYQYIIYPYDLDNMVVLYSGIRLDLSRTFSDYLIQDSSAMEIWFLDPKLFMVFIRKDDDFIPEIFSPEDKISRVKQLISSKYSIDFSKNTLTFNDEELQDEKRLLDYSVCPESTLEIKNHEHSEKKEHTPLEITLHITSLSRIRIMIVCDLYSDVSTLKEKIEDKTGINPKSQKLFFNSKQLVNERPLTHYSIVDGSELLLVAFEEKRFNVALYMRTKEYHNLIAFEVKETDMISDFKKEVFERTGVPIDKQGLVHMNDLLEDDYPFYFQGINSDTSIELLELSKQGKLIMCKSYPKLLIPIEVTDEDTVDSVKDMIKSKLKDASSEVFVDFNSVSDLKNGQKIVFTYKKPGDFTIQIRTLTQRFFQMFVSPGDKVIDVKEKIYDTEGIPPDQNRLIFNGGQLEDDELIKIYGVKEGSLVHSVLRLRG